MKSHYAASDEDDERKDMESPHDDVTSARVILAIVINNHDTYFALAFIYNFCETQLQVSISSIFPCYPPSVTGLVDGSISSGSSKIHGELMKTTRGIMLERSMNIFLTWLV